MTGTSFEPRTFDHAASFSDAIGKASDDLREHRAEVRGWVFRIVHLRAEEGLRDLRRPA